MLNNPHTIRKAWSGLYPSQKTSGLAGLASTKHLAWLLCSLGRLATATGAFHMHSADPVELLPAQFSLWGASKTDSTHTYVRLVLSTFPSCFQMPVLFYHSVIHGLGLFTDSVLSNRLTIFDSFIFVNDCMAMLRNTLMGSSKWGEKFRLV